MLNNLNSLQKKVEKQSVFIITNGCPESRIDVSIAETFFKNKGFKVTKDYVDADLIFFYACALTNKNEEQSLKIIAEYENSLNKNQRLVVCGCLPRINIEKLKLHYHGLICPGYDLKDFLPNEYISKNITANYLGQIVRPNTKNSVYYYRYEGTKLDKLFKRLAAGWYDYLGSRINLLNREKSVFFIKIVNGCVNNCSYCAVKNSRGFVKSKSIDDVISEFKMGLKKGFKKFALMGTDIGSYGLDIGSDLTILLQSLLSEMGDFKIYLRNLNPARLKALGDIFFNVIKSKKIKYIELPVQSGSNRILKLMKRNYSIEEYKNIVKKIREVNPSLIIRTQIIAGFPTETAEDFALTLKLLDDVIFDFIEVYEFSARPGTLAFKMEQVPKEIIRQRFICLYKKSLLNHTLRKLKHIMLNNI